CPPFTSLLPAFGWLAGWLGLDGWLAGAGWLVGWGWMADPVCPWQIELIEINAFIKNARATSTL
ncbi:MAG TPA: hypothetical protein PLS62_15220, partial [Desulfobacteraceae bacterium]|nr:hypothetical protein [Desulfobacteraceae bacterium]